MPPWAAEPSQSANDNARAHLRAVPEAWEDDATTLYQRSDLGLRSLPRTHPRPSRVPAEPQVFQGRPSSPDEPRFAIEGSLRRSLQPAAAATARGKRWLAWPGLCLLAVCAFFSVRALHWGVALPYVRSLAPLSGVAHEPPVQVAAVAPAQGASLPVEPAAASGELTAPVTPEPAAVSGDEAAIETFTLAEAAAATGGKLSKRQRAALLRKLHARRAHGATSHGRSGLARVIQPLRDPPDADEPEVAPARSEDGILQINSRPWARVLIDGRFVGHTPQLGLRVPPGRHHIQLVNEQMEMSKGFDITIRPGQTLSRVELLEDNPSSRK
jgi:hypothetical protein